ncbi:Hypothetical protein FKW44_015107 [Caligus rogercresseyi]|uniref:Uncharacterized protein n=1 Tax=Caligus rogercresseyi TaxID=217165 RepID=A0A7T8GZT7_CALRO|nr:Hypothetical protein FKW44_015107 [Caligus rogercresseyi]
MCLAGPESPLPRVRTLIPIIVLGGIRESFGRGLETPIPHHCAWRDPRVHWPRVRNPNTPSLCLTEPESLLDEGSLKLRNSS